MDKPVPEAVVHAFVDWLAKEMPPGTYISSPQWWASRIIRQIEFLTAAQQQGQVAPPSAPVGVEDYKQAWQAGFESALTQQPAAVDRAATNSAVAAIQFALKDPEGMTFLRLWNEGEFVTLRREWPDAPVDIYAALVGAKLATQHQEPTT